eukprot:scaffold32777_cov112-Isochrysis_galbana.AAC.4
MRSALSRGATDQPPATNHRNHEPLRATDRNDVCEHWTPALRSLPHEGPPRGSQPRHRRTSSLFTPAPRSYCPRALHPAPPSSYWPQASDKATLGATTVSLHSAGRASAAPTSPHLHAARQQPPSVLRRHRPAHGAQPGTRVLLALDVAQHVDPVHPQSHQ